MGQLELLFRQIGCNFIFFVISETWFGTDTLLGKYGLANYDLFCSSRPQGGGGGIAVYVNV